MDKTRRRLTVFADKFPLVGPLIWVLTVQYFAAQLIVAAAWLKPYSWRANTISDLGATYCGVYAGRYVCSPEHDLMNLSFLLLGLMMIFGAGLIYQEFRQSQASFVGFTLMSLAGFGTFVVGFIPENAIPSLHLLGAFLALCIGNISLVILGLALSDVRPAFRLYTFLSGVISLSALWLLVIHQYLGIGLGGMERLAAYPQTIWLILFGLYMTGSHYRRLRQKA